MKSVRRALLALGTPVLGLLGCREGTAPEPAVIIPQSTHVIPASVFAAQLESISPDSTTFVMKRGNALVDGLKSGDVLVSDAGLGILRKVLSTTDSAGYLVLRTTQASLTDAIEKGSAAFTGTFSQQAGGVKVLYQAPGLRAQARTSAGAASLYVELEDVVLYDQDGNPSTQTDRILANGVIELTPSLTFEIAIDHFELQSLTSALTLSVLDSLELRAGVSLTLFDVSTEVLRAQTAPIVVWVGYVPIVFSSVFFIEIGATGELYGSVVTSVSVEHSLTGGLQYADGVWTPIADVEDRFGFEPPKLSAGGELKGYVAPHALLLLYGLVGPYTKTSFYLLVDADVFRDPWLALYGGIELGAGVRLEVFSHVIADYEKPRVIGVRTLLWESPSGPPAAQLAFTTQPTSTIAGAVIAPAVQVTARDARGNTATEFTGDVTVAIGANPSGGTLSGTTRVAAVAGVATFDNLRIGTPGTGYTLTVTASGLTDATSAAFTITAFPTRLAFAVQPTTTTAGATITPAVLVAARDAQGNPAPTFTDSVTVAIGTNPSGGTLSGTTTVAAVLGVATFDDLRINTAGTGYTLTAAGGGLTGATSAPFAITLPATQLAFSVQPSTTTAGATITPAVQVTARDAQGNTATGFTGDVTVVIGTNPSGGALSGTTTGAAVAGVATFDDLSINAAGSGYTLTAAASELTGATSAAFTITPPPAELTFATVDAGVDHTCGVTTSGDAYCWGDNSYGELGDGTIDTTRTTPVLVSGGLRFAAVSAGKNHTCGMTTGGNAYCWGENFYGQLGDGTTTDRVTPRLVSGGLTFATVSAERDHTCGVTTSGVAYCWGWNSSGQLGNGTTTDRNTPVRVSGGLNFASVSAATNHTCGVTPGGAAYCWGSNYNGQLGDGTQLDRHVPVPVVRTGAGSATASASSR